MIQIDDLLDHLRRQLGRYSLIDSLDFIFAQMQHKQFGRKLPTTIEPDPEAGADTGQNRDFYEWELDLLCRELLQYAPIAGQSTLRRWNEFAATLNLLRHIDESIAKRAGETMQENILLEIGRIAYRTFPWQERPNAWQLVRYYKIFGAPALDAIIQAEIGITAKQLYILGFAFTGYFLTRFVYPYHTDFSIIGVDKETLKRFLRRFAAPLSELIKMAPQTEFRDENFCYSQNPLRIYPLVHTGVGGQHSLIAPIPTFLFRRISSGVYYELINHPGFSQAFGNSFQRYVGEVLEAALPAERFSVLPEAEYHVGKDRKDTIDWITSDANAHLFVECKTKRMQLRSRIALLDREILDADLVKIAEFIFQAYKAVQAAKDGRYPHWKPDDRPIYPIIVLLEEAYLFDPRLEQELDRQIADKLVAAAIDPTVMTAMPYSLCAAAEFEILAQVIAVRGIAEVMVRKTACERTKWNMKSFLLSEFGNDVSRIGKLGLFPDALNEIHPAISHPDAIMPDGR